MPEELITTIGWLEPLLPDAIPETLLNKADELRFAAGQLSGALPPETARRVSDLLQITNSYYSNLIEGQYTEPADMESASPRRAPKRPTKQLRDLAVAHVQVQAAVDRLTGQLPWSEGFSPKFLSLVHQHLFQGASPDDLKLSDGRLMTPGQLRTEPGLLVKVGDHLAPSPEIVVPMLERMKLVYGRVGDSRMRLLAALAYHHRLAWVHPFPDGNGRVVRMITHTHLNQIGLASPLWSLPRGLARRQSEYYGRLANADAPRRGDLDGRGQLSQSALLEFIEFMLDVCLDQVQYMKSALQLTPLRDRLDRLIGLNPNLSAAGIRPEAAAALHALLAMGTMPRNDFKTFLGLGERLAIDQLQRLIRVGLVESPTPKSRHIYPGLPVWFAQDLFPDLHRRFI